MRVAHYGGLHGPGGALDPALRELFQARRRQFLESLDAIPVSHRAVRLRAIQRALDTLVPLAAPAGDAPPNLAAVDRVVSLLDLARRETERVGPSVTITNTAIGGATLSLDLPDEYRTELAERFARRIVAERSEQERR